MILVMFSLLLLPLVWAEEIRFNKITFTEEYYKNWFSLFQLLFAFTFFTVFYNSHASKETSRKLGNLKSLIEPMLENIDKLELNQVEKLNGMIDLYISLSATNNDLDQFDFTFYYKLQKIKPEMINLKEVFLNPELKSLTVKKIEESSKSNDKRKH